MDFIGIIPARYASSRFPGKALCDIDGMPMICRTHESVRKWEHWQEVYVATDDHRIVEACTEYKIQTIVTSPSHTDCLDRAAETVKRLQGIGVKADRFIVIQGDEPLFNVATLDVDFSPEVVNFYTEVPGSQKQEIIDPNVVKVVVSKEKKALYFSRFSVPYDQLATRRTKERRQMFKQIGVYAFSARKIYQFHRLGSSYLENLEGIGLLRLLENDVDIHMRYTKYDSVSIDTPEDRERILEIMRENASS